MGRRRRQRLLRLRRRPSHSKKRRWKRFFAQLPDWKKVWDTPQDPAGYFPLAQFLQRTGELRKARNILEQAVALKPDPAARRQLAILQRTLDAQG